MIRDPENLESRFVHDLLGPSAGRVLEVGCGDGRLTGEIQSISGRLLGLDPDPDSIEKARHLLETGVNLILASGDSLPFADNSMDTVVFSLSLHHHPDPGTALGEARRVLRENGLILVLEPEAESPINQLFRIIYNEDHAYVRTEAAIEECGIEVTDQGTYETAWRFVDFNEMVAYLFEHFHLEPDPEHAGSMAELLPDHRDSKPLEVGDTTRYWVLRAGSGKDQTQVR